MINTYQVRQPIEKRIKLLFWKDTDWIFPWFFFLVQPKTTWCNRKKNHTILSLKYAYVLIIETCQFLHGLLVIFLLRQNA